MKINSAPVSFALSFLITVASCSFMTSEYCIFPDARSSALRPSDALISALAPAHAEAGAVSVPWSITRASATAMILADAKTGRVLYSRNADKRMYPASLTKMMTGLLALEKANPDSIVHISQNAADTESSEFMRSGRDMLLLDLVTQMLIVSENGAATALAEHMDGSTENFALRMNERAAQLGMTSTHFTNPHGLPDPAHYSTARDLLKLTQAVLKNAVLRDIVATRTENFYWFAPYSGPMKCENTNELLYSYSGAVGVKTGYTRAAGGCLAASAVRDGRELIAIVLQSDDCDARFTEAAALLDYGFSLQ